MSLKREQHKIAWDFFEKFQKNFDPSLFARTHSSSSSTEYKYDKDWVFKYSTDAWGLVHTKEIFAMTDTKVYLYPGYFCRRRIRKFLKSQYKKKQKRIKITQQMSQLDPVRQKIEDTFSTSTVEIHETLNNG